MAGDVACTPLPIAFDDGATVIVSVFPADDARATVVVLPALGVPAAYYEPLALALAARGLTAVTADLRGLGESSVRARRGVDFGYARLVLDAATIVSTVRQRMPAPVHVLGHSLGGHVGALLAGSRPGCLDGLVLTACGTPYWRRFPTKTGLQILGLATLVRVSGTMLGYFPGYRVGFGGTEAAQLMREWSGLARKGRLVAAGLDAEQAFAAARVRALVVSIDRDRMAPPSAVDHLAAKLAAAQVRREHVTAERADRRALDHFRWARLPEPVADLVTAWITAAQSVPLPPTQP
jgi:predicted alpha/beta hydrolase